MNLLLNKINSKKPLKANRMNPLFIIELAAKKPLTVVCEYNNKAPHRVDPKALKLKKKLINVQLNV